MKDACGIIVLAAGRSARLGRPKQSLVYNHSTLLQKMVRTAIETGCGPVVVVLGAHAEEYKKDCEGAHTIINEHWQHGMAGSIRCGLEALTRLYPDIHGAIITVCDQPHVTASLLRQLIDLHQQKQLPIIASDYGTSSGTPAFFHHSIFTELLQLEGDKGAKSILQKDKGRTAFIPFPMGEVDIDTEEDYKRLVGGE